MQFKYKQTLLIIGIILGIFFLAHNVFYYPVNGGYDFGLHSRYAKIISYERRIPSVTENREAYNPPFFYLTSGLVGKTISRVFNKEFTDSLKTWQYIGVTLAFISLLLWKKNIDYLHPKEKNISIVSLLLIFSLPVFHKTILMFTIEPFLLFLISLSIWYFIYHYQKKPNLINTIILSFLILISLLTRISSIILIPTIILGMLGLGFLKKNKWRNILNHSLIFLVTIFIGTSWFYFSPNRPINDINQIIPKDQQLSFFTDIPFKYMMTYPFRRELPFKKFIPIYYSEFWGDYWNYYSQRRFGISVEDRKADQYLITQSRINYLALQNRVNLPFTLVIICSFLYAIVNSFKLLSKKPSTQGLIQLMFILLSILTWIGFIYKLTHHATWKSDDVKASYMLYNIPIFIYFTSLFINKVLKKYSIIFIPTVIYLILVIGINLWWSWY